ncbi:MAG: hypothetical protein AVDCRST_MAG32-1449, partial [uncultured Nocardioides sp.]
GRARVGGRGGRHRDRAPVARRHAPGAHPRQRAPPAGGRGAGDLGRLLARLRPARGQGAHRGTVVGDRHRLHRGVRRLLPRVDRGPRGRCRADRRDARARADRHRPRDRQPRLRQGVAGGRPRARGRPRAHRPPRAPHPGVPRRPARRGVGAAAARRARGGRRLDHRRRGGDAGHVRPEERHGPARRQPM